MAGCATSPPKTELDLLLAGEIHGIGNALPKESAQSVSAYDPIGLLKQAEEKFLKAEYKEAADKYIQFLELHSGHRFGAYAEHQLAMSYYHQVKTLDRDPDPVNLALEAFGRLVTDYPNSPYIGDTHKKIELLKRRKMEQSLYVSIFYQKQGNHLAAISRLTGLLTETLPDDIRERALYSLALSYADSDRREEARETLQKLLSEPRGRHFADGTILMKRLMADEH